MMKLGFVSAILPDASLEEVFAVASRLGYDCVELMCWPVGAADRRYAGVTHLDVTHCDDARVAEVKELIAKYGVSISGLGYYPNPLSPDPAESETAVAHIRRIIETAPRLGVNQVNSFIGRDPSKSVDDNWQPFLDHWTPLVELAEQNEVRIGIENCPMFFTQDEWPGGKNLAVSPAIWRRMFEAIPSSHFGLNYDPSHLVWQQIDWISPLKEFANRVFHVHAKDARLDRDRLNDVGIYANPMEFHAPKLPGLGEIDWGRFIGALGDSGYRGSVCVEVEDRVYEGSVAARELALQQCHTFLRNYIPREHPTG
jgi:sugar phosphate isomerase/epimerase